MGFKGKKLELPAQRAFKVIAKNVAQALYARVTLEFKSSTDPYGQRWEPLRYRQGQPLAKTGRLKNSIVSRVDGLTATVSTAVKYAPFHQFGTARRNGKPGVAIPPRRFFPLEGKRSPIWDKAIDRAVRGSLASIFRKSGGK